MFTNEDRQKQRTGKYGTSRDQYLQDLVTQFQKTTSEEFKEQIVAHLANFSYDPFNYDHFRKLHILDLFLDCLTEPNAKLVEFALGGICNCCPDPANAAIIVQNGGIALIVSCLTSPVENTVLSAIAALYYLCTPSTKKEGLVHLRIRNIAKVFLSMHGS
ncbi:hypothetical protein O6H91_01G177000 [Diphasiastrum complanatum]|uniref:Uncharacterized protein n=1 Tax=Diphasiastrum complanatum TaxID=34168 RepID=A0ACC2EZ92_DIPCM|nr:hypothetical protein O6H91_01G177000 [Diphasiastrum complanatum]